MSKTPASPTIRYKYIESEDTAALDSVFDYLFDKILPKKH